MRSDYFQYDELGNRVSWNYVANRYAWYTFSREDNRLNQYLQWYSVVKYDDDIGGTWGNPQHANGVMMMDGNVTAGYNALNQPMMIWSANNPYGTWLWFGYDPLGRCVKRWYAQGDGSGADAPVYMVYDGWNLVQEGYSPWTPTRFYIQGGRVDEIVQSYNSATGLLAYHYYDASGHCTLLTDGQGTIKEQYYYDAFGYPYFYNGSGGWLGYSPHGNRFLFTGREWLSDLKLYDFRNRLYQPELGRFMQPDPKEFAAGDYNLYRYCHNDPVNKSDPTGMFEYRYAKDYPTEGPGGRKAIEAAINKLREKPHGRELMASEPNRRIEIKQTTGEQRTGLRGNSLYLNPKDPLFSDPETRGIYQAFPKEKPLTNDPDLARAIVLGHEFGHIPKGPEHRDESRNTPWGHNVRDNENLIRREHGLGDRPSYGGYPIR